METSKDGPVFGKDIMAKEFMLNPHYTFLNQGSYGNAPRCVIQHKMDMIFKTEEQPDELFRWQLPALWKENVTSVSEFVRSSPNNLVLVNNTTTGINAVVRSLPLQKGDGILIYSWTYLAVKNTAEFVFQEKGLELLYVDPPDSIDTVQQFVDAYEEMLKTHDNIKLVILDYISSVPPVLMPLKELIALCRRYNKMILIDGAHTPGQVDLNLETLGADFFVGNLHKWAYAPRGCAVLWIHPSFHKQIFPVVTSKFVPGDIQLAFSYMGTADYTNYFTTSKSIEFYKSIGGYEKISAYCTDLVERGADLIVTKWKTRHFQIPESMKAPYMRLVRMPHLKKFPAHQVDRSDYKVRISDLVDLIKYVWDRFHIQSVFLNFNNEPWCRLSASVYNEIGDYEKLADAILELLHEE